MLLAPGEYRFTVETESSGRIVTVQSEDSRWSGMIRAEGISNASMKSGSELQLARSESGMYVKALYLGDLGVTLSFATPKPGRDVRLTKSMPSATMAASGAH